MVSVAHTGNKLFIYIEIDIIAIGDRRNKVGLTEVRVEILDVTPLQQA